METIKSTIMPAFLHVFLFAQWAYMAHISAILEASFPKRLFFLFSAGVRMIYFNGLFVNYVAV